jgi:hypothetical protein
MINGVRLGYTAHVELALKNQVNVGMGLAVMMNMLGWYIYTIVQRIIPTSNHSYIPCRPSKTSWPSSRHSQMRK